MPHITRNDGYIYPYMYTTGMKFLVEFFGGEGLKRFEVSPLLVKGFLALG